MDLRLSQQTNPAPFALEFMLPQAGTAGKKLQFGPQVSDPFGPGEVDPLGTPHTVTLLYTVDGQTDLFYYDAAGIGQIGQQAERDGQLAVRKEILLQRVGFVQKLDDGRGEKPITPLINKAWFVPETKKVSALVAAKKMFTGPGGAVGDLWVPEQAMSR